MKKIGCHDVVSLILILSLFPVVCRAQAGPGPGSPRYRDAAYGGQSVRLENSAIRLDVHKRITGWGWVEISTPGGELVAVLDHLGEAEPVGLPGLLFPLRLEAEQFRSEKGPFGQRLVFPVRMRWPEPLAKTQFNNPALGQPIMEGEVSLTLDSQAPRVKLVYQYKPLRAFQVRYLQGPWLRVGAGSFGAAKTDGIFPGVEWLRGGEWSSGTDWISHPQALRVVPHPFKVTAPVMALSHQGIGIGLAWDPLAAVVAGKRYVQPVYATPNFIDRANHHLMGLMLPSVAWDMEENTLPVSAAKPPAKPLALRPEEPIRLEAEISLVKGTSFDVFLDWVKRHGLPQPVKRRWSLEEALDVVARPYNTVYWHEGRGWGDTAEHAGLHLPDYLIRYVEQFPERPAAKSLGEKWAWARKQLEAKGVKVEAPSRKPAPRPAGPDALKRGRELLACQRPDGSFGFDPDGRHKQELQVISAALLKPLGTKGDTGLDMNVDPARELLLLAEGTGEQQFRTAARRALDYSLKFERPDAGDWWETPLGGANLLAAGDAAIAYYLGYKALNDRRYLDKSVYWLRSLLVFTHLWQPEEVSLLYNTKPCLDQSIWLGPSWVNADVQWEVLRTFADASDLGIDWGKVDPEIDWRRYHEGITVAVLRWMVDHKDTTQKTILGAGDQDAVRRGLRDGYFFDSIIVVPGTYAAPLIDPSLVARNVLAVLERAKK